MLLQYTAKFYVFYKDGEVEKISEAIHIENQNKNFKSIMLISSDYVKQIHDRILLEDDRVKEVVLIDLQLTNKEDYKKRKSEAYVDDFLCAGNLLPTEPENANQEQSSEEFSES